MIVILGFYKRRSDLTWEEFSLHWRTTHASLLRNTPDIARYITRYVQHHIRPNDLSPNAASLEFDGISETWFESLKAREELLQQPALRTVMLPDEERFLDMLATRVSMLDYQAVQIGEEIKIPEHDGGKL